VNEDAIPRARARLELAGQAGDPRATDAALARAREGIEGLAETAAGLQTALPERIGEAVRESMRSEAAPVARQLAEVRGLAAQTIRRLERLQGELEAERHARVDDLALLVDVVESGWKTVAERLGRIEHALGDGEHAVVLRLPEHRASA